MTGSNGETRAALTNSFGYYQFIDVPAGETYILSVSAKCFQFTQSSQVRSILEETGGINFVADIWSYEGFAPHHLSRRYSDGGGFGFGCSRGDRKR